MTNLFQGKYRIPSARWQNWDYGTDAAYFITICTKHREHYFGKIENGKMCLSHVGILADVFWHEIKNHAKNVELDSFVVMPNHIHGILTMDGNNIDRNDHDDINENDHCNNHVETQHAVSLQTPQYLQSPQPPQTQQPINQTIGHQRFQNQGKNTVSSILNSYKSAVSKHAHRLGLTLDWQFRFYDHVIRDDGEYSRIALYIETNVGNWTTDKFFDPEE